jgi:hypothetical protein
LRTDGGAAASTLHAHQIDLRTVEHEVRDLIARGLLPRANSHPEAALRSIGVDVKALREQLISSFGREAVEAATRRVIRRPWWRGGGPAWTPLCGKPLLIKRALELAGRSADAGGRDVTADDVALGVIRDARDPLGTDVGRRGKRLLEELGFVPGTATPVRLIVEARGVELAALEAAVVAAQG